MTVRITKAQARAFRERWKAVNAAEREELRATTVTAKLRQLAALMGSVRIRGWEKPLATEEAEIRDRWKRLRKVFGA
ncbi:MAG: hypothetical protein HY574_10475 [candidate division NC10 bacterium]|nr:hypothetical protein [candidate division NC10 bacterium]